MLAVCGAGEGDCWHWAFSLCALLWPLTGVATVWWLKVVFERYETTMALPVEYGVVNVVSLCSGLIFFGEYRRLTPLQFFCSVLSILLVLGGICVGRRTALPKPFTTCCMRPSAANSMAIHTGQ